MASPDDLSPVKIEYDDDEEDDGLYPDIPDCLPILGSGDASEELLTPPTLYKRISEGGIILNPPYQRDPVWPAAKQKMLIDSLMINCPIPNILFAEVNRKGKLVKHCVDGQQRLTSIVSFMNGVIPYKHPVTKQNLWYTVPPSSVKGTQVKKFVLLPRRLKAKFDNIRLRCVTYRGIAEYQEREIFQRIQLGMPLGSAEKLQAIQSPRTDWACELIPKYLGPEDTSLAARIKLDCTRAKDFVGIARIAYCCESLPTVRLSIVSGLEAWLKQPSEPSATFKDSVDTVLQTMSTLANTPEYSAAFTEITERVAPVEFIFIGVMLYVLPDVPHAILARKVLELRRSVRQTHHDVRTNNKVVRSLWEFVSRTAEELKAETRVVVPPAKESKPKKARGTKRKAGTTDQVDEPVDISDGEVARDEDAYVVDEKLDPDDDADESETDELFADELDDEHKPAPKRQRTNQE